MTDKTIPADKVREILDGWERIKEYADWDDLDTLVKDIRDLLPTPPRPTLADMTREERAACQWMQADVADHDTRYVIANPHDRHGEVTLIAADGKIEWILPDYVTPRPDLPRMEWPGDKKPDPAPAPALPDGWRLADHKDHGRVIVTRPAPDRNGNVYLVLPDFGDPMGYGWLFCPADELTYIDTDQEAGTPTGPDHLAVGTVIESADDPRIDALPVGSILLDRDEEATTKGRGEWAGAGYIPIPSEGAELGPWTVLHIPKEKA